MAIIRTASDRILATVAGFTRVKTNEFGEYQSVLFEAAQLPEGKVWRSMEPEQAKQFRRGQRVHLVPTTNKKGRDSWDIELLSDAPATAPSAPVAGQPPADAMAAAKRAIAADVATMADLYGFCYAEAKRVLEPQGATNEGIQGCAFRLWHHAKDRL
ncbi:hypothetical protein C7293_13780 [filamentous cyanobacterium CCT1]|nr:hypothetical protein C7293_13780 [filamentous cyanobacterium CCT1]PSN80392.1 hypothetical protein C8B47_06710 [filamentous cyanobacterium CCP4]